MNQTDGLALLLANCLVAVQNGRHPLEILEESLLPAPICDSDVRALWDVVAYHWVMQRIAPLMTAKSEEDNPDAAS